MKIVAIKDVFIRTRIIRGLTQRELAKRARLSHSYVSLIESGGKTVGPATAKRLSDALELPMEQLFRID